MTSGFSSCVTSGRSRQRTLQPGGSLTPPPAVPPITKGFQSFPETESVPSGVPAWSLCL